MVEHSWIRVLPHWSWLPLNIILSILGDSPKDNGDTVYKCLQGCDRCAKLTQRWRPIPPAPTTGPHLIKTLALEPYSSSKEVLYSQKGTVGNQMLRVTQLMSTRGWAGKTAQDLACRHVKYSFITAAQLCFRYKSQLCNLSQETIWSQFILGNQAISGTVDLCKAEGL